MTESILKEEEAFHDEWASSIDVDKIDVDQAFTACTAPENRYIREEMGDVTNLKILDLGCGAGEAGVYLATQGADVVCSDLSEGMLHLLATTAKQRNVIVFAKPIHISESMSGVALPLGIAVPKEIDRRQLRIKVRKVVGMVNAMYQ